MPAPIPATATWRRTRGSLSCPPGPRLVALALLLSVAGCLDSSPDPYSTAARDPDRPAGDLSPAIIELRDRLLFPTAAGRRFIDFYYRYALFAARSIDPVRLPDGADRDGLSEFRGFLGLGFFVLKWIALLSPGLAALGLLFLTATVAALLRRLGRSTARAWTVSGIATLLFLGLTASSPTVRRTIETRERLDELRAAALREGPARFAKSLSDPDPTIRLEAAVGLAASSTPAELLPAQDGLKDPDPRVRMWCARALGRIQHLGSLPVLLPLLDDPEPLVRCYAAWGLGELRDRAALPALERLRKENAHIYVTRYAVDAIERIEGRNP
ncbi:MAG: HEAT repeat domain-containing protein [Planctomycetes bacterium]|nr:HEAT repeat domain-containing protein [Planctomycetota bacterium]